MAHLEGRTVLSTFGLISAGKGIETAISALAEIVPVHPDVLYLVAGQTHPEVVKEEGERYRLSLERLVRDLGLERNVQFLDRFLSMEELAFLLASTDLYLTPYRSREQIVSGALTFAVVAGCPVVSTPYFYAEDLLASGAGILVPFDEPTAFAKGVLQLLDNPVELAAAAKEARKVGAGLAWPSVGALTVDVLRLAKAIGAPAPGHSSVGRVASSPSIRPDHLLTLVDDVGIVQHADGVVPNRASGYCVDDMARLVIVALGLDREADDRTFARIVTQGIGFLRYAWDPAAQGMHNMMSYDRTWLDEPHSGDHLGPGRLGAGRGDLGASTAGSGRPQHTTAGGAGRYGRTDRQHAHDGLRRHRPDPATAGHPEPPATTVAAVCWPIDCWTSTPGTPPPSGVGSSPP